MPEENIIRKTYIAKTEIDDDERTVTAVISTSAVDREKEVLLPKGAALEQYLKNPVVLWAHEYRETPIARALWLKSGRKNITAKAKFAETEKADEIYQLFKGGYLNAFSVGFLPAENGSHPPTPEEVKKNPEWAEAKRIYDKWELLEFSAVPVPANPEALAVAVKTKEVKISPGTLNDLGYAYDEEEMFYIPHLTNNNTNTISLAQIKQKLGLDEQTTYYADTIVASAIEKDIEAEAVLKPYPNEHSCRLKPPNYPKYRRQKCAQKHDGKCIDVIYGIKSPKKSEIQALRYPKNIWTASAARSHCKTREGSFEAAKTITRRHPIAKKSMRGKLRRHIDPKECAETTEKILKGKME